MAARRMKVSKCPSDALTMTNRAIVNPGDFDKKVCILMYFYLLSKTLNSSPAPTLMFEQAPVSILFSLLNLMQK